MDKTSELQKLHNENDKEATIISNNSNGSAANKKQSRDKQKPLGEQRKAVLRQQLMVLLGNTGVLGCGMSVALPSVTLTQLMDTTQDFYMNTDQSSWYSSINTMACPIGGILVGYLLDILGRKRTMLVTNIVGILGWGLLFTAPYHPTKEAIYIQILVARFFSGIMIGLCLSPVGVYSAEISLPKIRGRLIVCTSLGVAAGILFMYILGYFIRNDWQLIAQISCAYQFVSALCVFPMPESPVWLMQCGREEKARKSLKYFRGLKKNDLVYCEEFEVEFAQLTKNNEISRNTAAQETSLLKTLKAPEVWKPLIIMIIFFAFQQFSGVVTVIVFAVQIVKEAGVKADPVLCAVFVGIARIVTTFFVSSIFERWGRKPAGILSASGMAVCMLVLAAFGWFPTIFDSVKFVPVICIVLYIIFSTMGLYTLPFFMISEVFPQRVRGACSGTTICVGLIFSFLVLKIYPGMEKTFGISNVFAFFGFVCLGAILYIYILIPETRGRTLVEIEDYFRNGRITNTNVEIPLTAIVLSSNENVSNGII